MAFLDNFTGSEYDNLSVHTPDIGTWTEDTAGDADGYIIGSGGTSLAYATSYASNTASTSNPTVVLGTDQGDADHTTEFKVVLAPANEINYRLFELVSRFEDADNFLFLQVYEYSSTGLVLRTRIAGANTVILAVNCQEGSVYKLALEGTTATIYEDSIEVGSATVPASSFTRQGFAVIGTIERFGKPLLDYVKYDLTIGDVTPPILSLPTVTVETSTTATGTVTTDEANGTLFSVTTQSASVPSVSQIKAGQDHLGATADFALGGGAGQAVSTVGVQTMLITGLTPVTNYYIHSVQDDAATNTSNIVSSTVFTTTTTIEVSLTNHSSNPSVNGTPFASKTGIEFALFNEVTLGSLGAPVLSGNSETTDATGIMTLDVSGVLEVADPYLVIVRDGTSFAFGEGVV